MKLSHGLHLAYCTNIHRGETWGQTFETLEKYALAVRDQVGKGKPYAIGLRLGDQASRELSDPKTLKDFRAWLDRENCYVFTVNGFPFGTFHGARVKEKVYAPDWTTDDRVVYTNRLFDLLAQLVPSGIEGSVSTVPCSYKEFIQHPEQVTRMQDNLSKTVAHIEELSRKTGKDLHLGLEPEPLCYLETSQETGEFFEQLWRRFPGDDRLRHRLGVNYDTCHLGVEYEDPSDVLRTFQERGIRISKIHLSNALKVRPTAEVRSALQSFADDIYFHQTIERRGAGPFIRHKDLDVALATPVEEDVSKVPEWRIHFHIPLHSQPTALFDNTSDHLLGVLDAVGQNPNLCSHFEMETYTWEVMPAEMKKKNVVDQLVAEYRWTLGELAQRGITLV